MTGGVPAAVEGAKVRGGESGFVLVRDREGVQPVTNPSLRELCVLDIYAIILLF